MKGTLHPMLSMILAAAPSVLVDDAARDAITRLGALLPEELSRGMYLECRLSGVAARVDLATCVEDAGRALLGSPSSTVDEAIREAKPWRPIRALCREWADERSPLHRHVARLWLEFDTELEGEALGVPLPGVFVDFSPSVACLSTDAQVALSDRVLQALGTPSTPRERRLLRAVLGALGENGFVFSLGFFPHRPHALRLCLAGLRTADALALLRALRWAGDHDAIAALAGQMQCAAGGVWGGPTLLHLDLETRLLDRVGIEYALPRRGQAEGALRHDTLLCALHDAGWCSADKWEALAAWPGVALRRLEHEWRSSIVTRRVNHLKVVWNGPDAIEAKAYLFERFVSQPAAARGSQQCMPAC